MGVTVSIIIPVLNEEARIAETIDHIRSLTDGKAAEIIVVDGDPAGGTLRAIPDGACRKLLSEPGRGRQLNRGAGAASGEILLFLHADTKLPPDALVSIGNAFRDPTPAGGAFDLAIDSPRRAFRLIERVASLRTRLTRIPYGDQAIFLRSVLVPIARGIPRDPHHGGRGPHAAAETLRRADRDPPGAGRHLRAALGAGGDPLHNPPELVPRYPLPSRCRCRTACPLVPAASIKSHIYKISCYKISLTGNTAFPILAVP